MARKLDMNLLRTWIGRSECRTDVFDPKPLAALDGIMDRPAARVNGEIIPIEALWIYFLEPFPQSQLGIDGHPRRGEFMPPVNLPRRMWAGVEIEVTAPIQMGERLERVSEIADIVLKDGRNGPLVFVKVRNRISGVDGLRVTETTDYVYRDIAPVPTPVVGGAIPSAPWSRTVTTDPVLLFRYSAVTFNSHRIHYDQAYAATEGYSGLLVQGPLIATLLLDLCREYMPDGRVVSFEGRATRPLFCGESFRITGVPSDDGRQADLCAWTPDGNKAFVARVDFAS